MDGRLLPLDGYIRVSVVGGRSGDRFQSPTEQREAIEGWARLHGVRLGEVFEDLDRSGGTMDRPGMREALRRVEEGKSGGVIVARLDRFARTLVGGLTTVQELDDRGARVVSVAEAVDPATPMGRAMLGLLLLMAQWQRDQADEALGAAQRRAVAGGRFPGRTPFGYRRDDAGQTLVDEPAAEVVRRIFAERAGGAGWRGIADRLTDDGVPTPFGRRAWASTTVQGIVKSEAPLGVFRGPRGLRVEEAWPAIVDREAWEEANGRRGVRDDARRHRDRLLAGVARCAGCRYMLKRTVNPEGFVSYGCRTRGCLERSSVGAGVVDDHVAGLIDERLARAVLEPREADGGEELARLIAARDAAGAELELWRDDLELRAALGDRDWREGMLARARARDDAETGLAEHRARGGLRGLADLPGDRVPTLAGLPWEGRRAIVELFVHSVWVRRSPVRGPGARRRVAERVRVVWRDEPAPPALPSRHGAGLGPVPWPASPPR